MRTILLAFICMMALGTSQAQNQKAERMKLIRSTYAEAKKKVEANGKNMNDLKLQKQHEDKVAAEKLAEAKKEAEELKDKFIETTMKVGANGKAFGSVSSKEVAELIKTQLGRDYDKKKIIMKDAAKALGNYKVGIKLHQEVTAEITLRVVEEKQ